MAGSFSIPCGRAEVLLEVKKSRFIGWADYAGSRRQALAVLEQARERYPDARHHCWAYLIGAPDQPQTQAMSDDGEPSGTAGKPILNVLQHQAIGNIVVVVSRYFGGIKLGAGGLVRAYSQSAQHAVDALALTPFIPYRQLQLQCAFSQESEVRRWLIQHQGQMQQHDYRERVEMTLSLPEPALDDWRAFADPAGIRYRLLD